MNSAILPLAAAALIVAGQGQIWSTTADAADRAVVVASQSGKSDERMQYEAETAKALTRTEQRVDAIKRKDDALPEYEDLDEGMAAIKQQWSKTKTMVGEDWQEAKRQFERDYQALKRQIDKLAAD